MAFLVAAAASDRLAPIDWRARPPPRKAEACWANRARATQPAGGSLSRRSLLGGSFWHLCSRAAAPMCQCATAAAAAAAAEAAAAAQCVARGAPEAALKVADGNGDGAAAKQPAADAAARHLVCAGPTPQLGAHLFSALAAAARPELLRAAPPTPRLRARELVGGAKACAERASERVARTLCMCLDLRRRRRRRGKTAAPPKASGGPLAFCYASLLFRHSLSCLVSIFCLSSPSPSPRLSFLSRRLLAARAGRARLCCWEAPAGRKPQPARQQQQQQPREQQRQRTDWKSVLRVSDGARCARHCSERSLSRLSPSQSSQSLSLSNPSPPPKPAVCARSSVGSARGFSRSCSASESSAAAAAAGLRAASSGSRLSGC